MRNIIIGLSIVCFALSGMVILKALGLPQQEPRYKITPQAPEPTAPEAEALLGQLARKQEANRDILEELQAAIAHLEDKLSKKEEAAQAKAQTQEIKKETIILAVLGSGTFGSGQVEINAIDENLKIIVNELVRDISASPDHRVVIEAIRTTCRSGHPLQNGIVTIWIFPTSGQRLFPTYW